MKLRRILFAAAVLSLAPVLITVTNRYGDSLWLIPVGLLPILLLGEHWPMSQAYAALSVAGLSGTGPVAGAVASSLRGRAGPTRFAFFHCAVSSGSPLIASR